MNLFNYFNILNFKIKSFITYCNYLIVGLEMWTKEIILCWVVTDMEWGGFGYEDKRDYILFQT